jgi:single-stranded DNA-binding protein
VNRINTVTISGNIANPEVKQFGENTLVEFSLCQNRSKKTGNDWADEPHWYPVKCWDKHVAAKLQQGDFVTVSGILEQEKWEDKETKQGRSKLVIRAFEVSSEAAFRKAEDRELVAAGVTAGTATDDDIPF